MWLRRLLLALTTTFLSLLSMVTAIVSCDFAAGGYVFCLLLALPLTLGLPTTLVVLLVTSLWPGGEPLWLFALLCLGGGTALQLEAFALLRRLWRRS
jgi:hypothetical protein